MANPAETSQTFQSNLAAMHTLLEVGAAVLTDITGDEATATIASGNDVSPSIAADALASKLANYLNL